MRPLIIGIAGGSGSGKTTLVNRLAEQFGEEVTVITHASYYTPRPDLTDEERAAVNFDHPASFDTDQLIADLEALIAGKTVQVPVYDYAIRDRLEETRTVAPTKIILVEGMLIFENKALRSLFDIRLYVDTDDDVRLLRRLLRDVKERGLSLDEVAERYLSTVRPMHRQFVEPSKRYADLILPEGGESGAALLLLIQRMAYHIENGDIVDRQ